MKVSIEGGYVRLRPEASIYGAGYEDLLPQEVDRFILELRRAANIIYSTRNKSKPFYKP
ncbi:MAG: hypothetical protein KGJ13_08690 [Patescibacteria group bacterium]|nr:hypothetical protein [Patescibacteria group bacterium]